MHGEMFAEGTGPDCVGPITFVRSQVGKGVNKEVINRI
jgi:hypothetical protein